MPVEVTRWSKKVLNASITGFYGVGALGCFGLSIYCILLNRAASAGVAATFAVAFVLLRHLPVIESFKAFNMEAKFARRVDEFDKLLAYIRSAAEASSQLLYIQLGYSGRMAPINWARKRELMNQLDENLSELGVDAEFIEQAKRPVLNFAIWDLYAVFRGTAQTLLRRHLERISGRMNEIQNRGPIPAGDSEWNELNEEKLQWTMPSEEVEDMAGPTRLQNVRGLIDDLMNRLPWTSEDKATLAQVGGEVETLATGCWEAGTITPETEEYVILYGHKTDDRLKLLEARV